ncbi:MAG: cytochrome-c peroxidase [Pseudomonadales bacterium]|nr:cytochrome-c peroxidase [Pseudomonadales bacterium]
MRLIVYLLGGIFLAACLPEQQNSTVASPADNTVSTQMVTLGDKLFHDVSLSSQGNQACASCHDVNRAFSDADKTIPVSKGSEVGQFGTRNTPAASYTRFIPPLHQEQDDGETLWIGGLFLDGRVNNLEEQAQKPFFFFF